MFFLVILYPKSKHLFTKIRCIIYFYFFSSYTNLYIFPIYTYVSVNNLGTIIKIVQLSHIIIIGGYRI